MPPFKFMKNPLLHDTTDVLFVHIDSSMELADDFLKSIYYLLRLPEHFGYNWDALYDCLRDLSWISCRKIIISHDALPRLPEQDLKIYLEILRDAVLDWKNDEIHDLVVIFKDADKSVIEDTLININ